MITSNMFLGQPPARIKQWIIDHHGGEELTPWGEIVKKLENFDTTKTPIEQGLPEVGSGITTKYMICDGYMDNGVFVQCLTKDAVMSNIDKIDAVDTPWIVLGYNGTVPQYVKYRNGKNYLYISSVNDTVVDGFLRPIAAGCKTYTRGWGDSTLRNTFTDSGKTVASVGASTFTYGQTNASWGTTATTAGGYSVPTSIVVDGDTYDFCGYTMALQTQHELGSSKDGVTITENSCAFGYSTSTSSGQSSWFNSHMRTFLNARVGHNEIVYPRVEPTANMLGFTNSIGLKLAKDLDFLKHTAPSINRNWVHSSWTAGGNLDANSVSYTANDFFLLGNAGVNCNDSAYYHGNGLEEFAIFSTIYPENTDPGSSGKSTYRLKYKMNDLQGNPATSAATWRLSSAYISSAHNVAYVNSTGYVNYTSTTPTYPATYAYGLAPACSIY